VGTTTVAEPRLCGQRRVTTGAPPPHGAMDLALVVAAASIDRVRVQGFRDLVHCWWLRGGLGEGVGGGGGGVEGTEELTRKKPSDGGCRAEEDNGRGSSRKEDDWSPELVQGGRHDQSHVRMQAGYWWLYIWQILKCKSEIVNFLDKKRCS
jgi:hypothetical protein